jgi:hypothetical protein
MVDGHLCPGCELEFGPDNLPQVIVELSPAKRGPVRCRIFAVCDRCAEKSDEELRDRVMEIIEIMDGGRKWHLEGQVH